MKVRGLHILKKLLIGLLYTVLGTVVGVLGLYIYILQSGPKLQVWHRVHLEQEFTAAKSDEVKTLEDYLALEDRLFQEMEDKVYSQTSGGQVYALDRYQHGSLSDPTTYKPNYNRTFEWKSQDAKAGLLLLHGLSDSPYSMVGLGRALHAKGMQVLGLRLPGHGTVPSALVHAQWQDLAAATRIGMRHLRKTLGPDKPIYIMGYSTGAALAVDYSLDALGEEELPRAEALVLISPAIGVSPAATFAKWQSRLSWVLGMEKVAWTDLLPEYDPYKYGSFAVNAGDLIHQLTLAIGAKLDVLTTREGTGDFPRTLAISSSVDATVSMGAVVDQFLARVGNEGNEFVLFDIDRLRELQPILAKDPQPEIQAILGTKILPFTITIVTNKGPETREVVTKVRVPGSQSLSVTDLHESWPRGVHSVAHISLPFSPADPLYGATQSSPGALHLGDLDARGEKGVLSIPAGGILRLRYNPFFRYTKQCIMNFLGQ